MNLGAAARVALYGILLYDAAKKWRKSSRLGDLEEDERGRGRGAARGRIHNVRGIDERVRHIVKKTQQGRVDPAVVYHARRVVSKKCGNQWCIPERDYAGEVRAIFADVRSRVRYVRDAWGIDQFTGARRTLFDTHGEDCDGFSISLGAMLGAIGYPVRLRVIRTVDSAEWNHIYNLVGMPDGRWVPLDASVSEPPGWEAPKRSIAQIRDYEVP